ncbi:MAG: hypothetical protein GY794_11480 [bacterium]|nr:hypothetical protein [bacterium]
MNEKIETTARHLVGMLVKHDFAGVEALSGGVRLSQKEMEQAVRDYPATLVMPEGQPIPDIDAIEVTGSNPSQWSVDIPLWTNEEGRSDLTMQVTMIESGNELLDVEVDNIHVL